MSKRSAIISIIIIVVAAAVLLWTQRANNGIKPSSPPADAPVAINQGDAFMQLTSSAFAPNQSIPSKYTCDGQDVSPQLIISDVPANAKTLVLIVDDPDAPRGDWVHWTVWNITPDTREIGEGSVPAGAMQGMTDFGRIGWGGPCPPSGTHRYQFKLYALDTTLSLPSSARKADIEQAIAGHILEQTMLVGLYHRN